MALTVFTAQNQALGPININRDRPFSFSVQGTFSAGSAVVLERARLEENTYRTVQTFASSSTPHEEDCIAMRGWKYRLRCTTLNAPDAPSGEIICL